MSAEGAWVIVQVFAGIFGLLFGSFMNVCVARMPEDRSVVWPGSACPSCGTPIKGYDNVPVLAWFWLMGKCRACKAPISALYPLVEASFGVLTVLLFRHVVRDIAWLDLPHLAAVAWYGWLCFSILAMTLIDLRHKIIPDEFSIYSVPVGVGGAALLGRLGFTEAPTWQQSVVGALVGGGLLAAVIGGYWLWRREEGMGWGDVKLLAMFGAFLGALPALPVIVLVASVAGSAVGLTVILARAASVELWFSMARAAAVGAGVGLLAVYGGTWLFVEGLGALGLGATEELLGALFGPISGAFPGAHTVFPLGLGMGAVVGSLAALFRNVSLRMAVPFGPFLGLGALVWIFFGGNIALRWTPWAGI